MIFTSIKKHKSTNIYSNSRHKMKNYLSYLAILLLFLTTSCGTMSYQTSNFQDSIYYTPTKSNRQIIKEQQEELTQLIQETEEKSSQWTIPETTLSDTLQDTLAHPLDYTGWYNPYPYNYYGPSSHWSLGFSFGWTYPYYSYYGPYSSFGFGWYDPWYGYGWYDPWYNPWYNPWYGPGFGPGFGPGPMPSFRDRIYGKRDGNNQGLRNTGMGTAVRQPRQIRGLDSQQPAYQKPKDQRKENRIQINQEGKGKTEQQKERGRTRNNEQNNQNRTERNTQINRSNQTTQPPRQSNFNGGGGRSGGSHRSGGSRR